jgi:hypothetical protein
MDSIELLTATFKMMKRAGNYAVSNGYDNILFSAAYLGARDLCEEIVELHEKAGVKMCLVWNTILRGAAKGGKEELCFWAVENEANDFSGMLYEAAKCSVSMCLLANEWKKPVPWHDDEISMMFDHAVMAGNIKIVDLARKWGAKPEPWGCDMLLCGTARFRPYMCEYLKKLGAQKFEQWLDALSEFAIPDGFFEDQLVLTAELAKNWGAKNFQRMLYNAKRTNKPQLVKLAERWIAEAAAETKPPEVVVSVQEKTCVCCAKPVCDGEFRAYQTYVLKKDMTISQRIELYVHASCQYCIKDLGNDCCFCTKSIMPDDFVLLRYGDRYFTMHAKCTNRSKLNHVRCSACDSAPWECTCNAFRIVTSISK